MDALDTAETIHARIAAKHLAPGQDGTVTVVAARETVDTVIAEVRRGSEYWTDEGPHEVGTNVFAIYLKRR